MNISNLQRETDEGVKRFKIDDDNEINFTHSSQFHNQPPPMEIDSSSLIRLRKGNLVIRRSITK